MGGWSIVVASLSCLTGGIRPTVALHGRVGRTEDVASISRSAEASAAAVPGTVVQLIPLPEPPLTAPPATAPPTVAPTPAPTTSTPAPGSTTPPAQPPGNPGNTRNCPDFATYAEAKQWFDTYFPYYGDVAKLDADDDGIPCETLPGAPA